ncbi:helix-turn-helix transcriptional regulator [Staphylococcus kloosii]|jgi:predicted transcriptional regulator YheO|uniref:helix-turn-helix transcriptional regulator n=1 Tax=Staphylococcus kloosii TaxID=29384 RepID=UPI00189D2F45|nr:PAS domain-containing protein [Staphylococcus kloosii]MBF7024110.1 PAS domain-containing protein [Staphylococcus kloosii]
MTSNNDKLNTYIPIAKTIGKMFGQHCEVILHDLNSPQSSVIFTINNHVTGRKVGQSFDHLVNTVLASSSFKDDFLAGYEFTTEDQRRIKSSTTLIRNESEEIIGALCINFDISLVEKVQEFVENILPANIPNSERANSIVETNSTNNVRDITEDLINKIIANSNYPNLKRQDKIDLIKFMDDKGIFLMKGSVDKVSEQMGISKVTVYSYLDEIKKQKTDRR